MRYSPLVSHANEIRLLSLLPGQSSGQVRCTLYVVDLSNAPPFDALSYTWGDPNITKSIQVNDSAFQATTNLEAFLRQRQTEHEQRPLWIDAVCINQADVLEKTAQVLKMADIYEKCTWLTIWLGLGTIESDFALQTLINAANGELRWGPDGKEDKAIENLMKRPWWTRVWIVQEIGFGAKGGVYGFDSWCDAIIDDQQTRLVCGSTSIGWGQLVRAAVNITKGKNSSDSLRTLLLRNVRSLEDGRQDVSEDYLPGHSQLLVTLSQHRSRLSTDPRDKVFALLRLAPKVRGDLLQADYSASFGDVLRRLVQREIHVAQTLNVLRYCQRRSQTALSSWTPDWSKAEEEVLIPNMMTAIHVKPFVRFSNDLQALHVNAVFWDVIDAILELPTSNSERHPLDMNFLVSVHESRQFVRQMASPNPYGSENARVNAFWQTLFGEFQSIEELRGDCLGYSDSVSCIDWLPPLPEDWKLARTYVKDMDRDQNLETWVFRGIDFPNNPFGISVPDPFQHLRKESILAAMEEESLAMQALRAAALHRGRHIFGRRLFTTKKGYIGLGPPDCVRGDSIVVLLGAEVPFVLRPHDDHFRLIGETYVRGIMLGQVMDEVKNGKAEVSEVTLR